MKVKLRDVSNIIMGQSPDSSTYNTENIGLPFFQGNADFGELNPIAKTWCSAPIKIAYKNYILISVRAPIGALNIAAETCCIGRGLAALDVNNKICTQKYLWYLLEAKKNELISKGTGSTFKAISKNILSEMEFNIPPVREQELCTKTLDVVFCLIRLKKEQLDKLDLLVKSRFVELFLQANESFPKKKLGECTVINPKKSMDTRLKEDLIVSFVPMASVGEDGSIDTSEKKLYREVKSGFTYFIEGDVLFAKITPCMENGKGAVAINLYNGIGFGSTEFHVIRPLEGFTNPVWLYNLSVSKKFRLEAEANMTGSAGQKRTPASFLQNYEIKLPPIELQNQFADFAEQVDKSKLAIQQSLDELETLKKSLMQQYFG